MRTYIEVLPVRDAPNAAGIVRTRYRPALSDYEGQVVWQGDVVFNLISEATRAANMARNVRFNKGQEV